MLGLESVLAPGQGAGHRGADHPGAALPGQPRDRVLVPRRLGNLEHHLVALQLARQASRVNLPSSGATSRVGVAVTENDFFSAAIYHQMVFNVDNL